MMRSGTTKALADLKGTVLFSHAGEPVQLEKTVAVSSWKQAMESCGSDTWEEIRLEAANLFSEAVFKIDKSRFNQRNQIIEAFKPQLLSTIHPRIQELDRKHSLGKKFRDSVEWDLTHWLLETDHADVFVPGFKTEGYLVPSFYLGLGTLYLKGHFPCGWAGAWPEGNLLVY